MNVHRVVRPTARGPYRPGICWELFVVIVLATIGWVLMVRHAGRALGWWS